MMINDKHRANTEVVTAKISPELKEKCRKYLGGQKSEIMRNALADAVEKAESKGAQA